MSHGPIPGKALVTRRALRDVVRAAAQDAYGVTGFAGGGPIGRLRERLGLGHRGVRVTVDRGLVVELQLTIAYGLPIAEVARQVDASVRYALRRAIGREPDRVSIRVAGLRYDAGSRPPTAGVADDVGPGELAASGVDVA
ncbi:MAG: Asp23/Gls24 family envelope stress response protein [Chloroflexota bacterium]